MVDIEKLKKVYLSYGFEIIKIEEGIIIFLFKKSRYFGVDILYLEDSKTLVEKCEKFRHSYSDLGYGVQIKFIETNQEAENELFKSFFSLDFAKNKLSKKYADFCSKQEKNILGTYQYINTNIQIHNDEEFNCNLLEIIESKLNSIKPELVIIEAAAGFGKTCSAFEIVNFFNNSFKSHLPILTELSRNRGVKKFRYILLDEIDLEFPSLSSSLVIQEIKNGRIPLIVDGFDELIDKNIDNTLNTSFEEVETMLDTIGALLVNRSKIILTTRKTAIFAENEFEKWMIKWGDKFHVTRIAINEPRIKDWLGADRYSYVKEKNIPVQYLANPVILSFLRNIPIDIFGEFVDNPQTLVQEYFEKMLEREKTRQGLIMSVESQLEVFKNVTKLLIEFDSSGEEKSFFKALILDTNKKLLESTKNSYSKESDKHNIETLVDTLSNHALLDRKGRDEERIGFVNDFIYGTLIGDVLIADSEKKLKPSHYIIELAVTAYRIQSSEKRNILWELIQNFIGNFPTYSIFLIDIYLKSKVERAYKDISISDLRLFEIDFSPNKLESIVFINCRFYGCFFEIDKFNGVSFINCSFEKCTTINDLKLLNSEDLILINCSQKNCLILDELIFNEDDFSNEFTTTEILVLKNIYEISNLGGNHFARLMLGQDNSFQKEAFKVIEKLQKNKYIEIKGFHFILNLNKLQRIKEIIEIN